METLVKLLRSWRLRLFAMRLMQHGFQMHIDAPAPATMHRDTLQVAGWVFNLNARIVAVELLHAPGLAIRLRYGVPRPDVQRYFCQHPAALRCGFEGEVALAGISPGPLNLLIRATDERGHSISQSIAIEVDNPTAMLEVDALTWRDEHLYIEGWFLWPGSQPPHYVSLQQNERSLGSAQAHFSRPDIRGHFSLPEDFALLRLPPDQQR